jgi:hypothetical protein
MGNSEENRRMNEKWERKILSRFGRARLEKEKARTIHSIIFPVHSENFRVYNEIKECSDDDF